MASRDPLTCDVLIVGGGVLGTAVAARLAQTNLDVCLVERTGDVAEGASKGNAGIVSSYYAAPGTLEARLITASVFRWDEVCRRLNVPFRRIGAIMPALNEAEAAGLAPQRDEALACGVRAEIIAGEEARRREPLISAECIAALVLPDEGVIDPMRLTCAFAELAARNGAVIRFDSPVIGFVKEGERIVEARTPRDTIRAGYVVNTAGLHADVVSRLAGGDAFRMWPRRGQFWVLDREFGASLSHIIFAAPAKETKGIHVVPTSRGSVLLGPTVEDGEERDDKATSAAKLEETFARAHRLVPSLTLDHAIKTYAALRPASEEPFFVRIDRRIPNLIHAVSRSIGISTSLGVADYVVELLQGAGLNFADDPDAVRELPAVPLIRHIADPTVLPHSEWNRAQIICVCEQVTAAEIEAALTARVPARSVDGVWKRTGAAGGRCQGSICMAGIIFMCSVHMRCPPERVPQKDQGELGVGRAV